ncbi:MAG: hypothetical protein JNK56_37855, partial [Myxococcales bacterium]|nr:hypothetical protein [Myxococcales bacterium]
RDLGAAVLRGGDAPLMPANIQRRPLAPLRPLATASLPLLRAEPALERAPAPLATGWITFASWTNNTGQPVSYFATTWKVPAHPTARNGQLIYLFNGIQNASFIYQPVLQWGSSPAGGGDYWAVASWYVSSGPVFHSDLVRVEPGEDIVGVMRLTRQSTVGGTRVFDYDCEFQGRPGTALPVENIPELTWCIETLEAYDLTGCADYPVGRTAMRAIELRTGANHAPVAWTVNNAVTDCGQSTVVVTNGSPGGQVDLLYCSAPAQPAARTQPDRLLAGQGLLVNQAITSADGRFRLILQADGNLVLYTSDNRPLWASNTAGHPEVFDAVLQSDGNFVLYNACGRPMWASNTVGHAGAWIVLQNDGNL